MASAETTSPLARGNALLGEGDHEAALKSFQEVGMAHTAFAGPGTRREGSRQTRAGQEVAAPTRMYRAHGIGSDGGVGHGVWRARHGLGRVHAAARALHALCRPRSATQPPRAPPLRPKCHRRH
jgi:hypothetical protein